MKKVTYVVTVIERVEEIVTHAVEATTLEEAKRKIDDCMSTILIKEELDASRSTAEWYKWGITTRHPLGLSQGEGLEIADIPFDED